MLDINFDEKINELNSEIESLRMALAKADERKTNFQSAKGLISEITGDIREKLELLAQWLPADALTTAVRVIIREVESCESEIMPTLPPIDIDIDDDSKSDDDLPDGGYYPDDNPPNLPGDSGGEAEVLEAAEYFAVETFHQEEDQEEIADEQEQLELGLPSENESSESTEDMKVDNCSDNCSDNCNKVRELLAENPLPTKAIAEALGDYAEALTVLTKLEEDGIVSKYSSPQGYWSLITDSDSEETKEPEKNHDLTNQIDNTFTPLEQFGDFISYRQVPGESGFICYLSANNKERLERWQNFLIVSHSFADCSEIFTPKDDKEARTFKGKHCLKLRHLSSEALLWIRENYDEKSATLTYKEISEWKRPPVVLAKPYVPSWYVRIDGETAFTGSEAEAREIYAQLIKANSEDQKNWSVALLDNNYAKIDSWFKGEALPVSVPVVQEVNQEVDQELELATPF